MAISFRSQSVVDIGSGSNITFSPPSGLADGDILVAGVLLEGGVAITPPTGFTLVDNIASSAEGFELFVYWKRASSESGNYVFTHDSTGRSGFLAAYSGCVASGSPIDGTPSTNEGTSTSITATGITTTANNSMVIFVAGLWTWAYNSTPPSGMTERYDNTNAYYADVIQATAGSTGDKTATASSADDYVAILLALKEATTVVSAKTSSMLLGGVGA